jgi:hypothetical protein
MKVPVNLLVFLAVAGVFYLVILPKKNAFVSDLMKSMGAGHASREDSVKAMVSARIIVDMCPMADLSDYRPKSWADYNPQDEVSSTITHTFTCDGVMRTFLFRLRYGSISEIIDLR